MAREKPKRKNGVRPVGVSLREDQVRLADRLAVREGVSRSRLVGLLIERAGAVADGGVPSVVVGGRRFVPADGE